MQLAWKPVSGFAQPNQEFVWIWVLMFRGGFFFFFFVLGYSSYQNMSLNFFMWAMTNGTKEVKGTHGKEDKERKCDTSPSPDLRYLELMENHILNRSLAVDGWGRVQRGSLFAAFHGRGVRFSCKLRVVPFHCERFVSHFVVSQHTQTPQQEWVMERGTLWAKFTHRCVKATILPVSI